MVKKVFAGCVLGLFVAGVSASAEAASVSASTAPDDSPQLQQLHQRIDALQSKVDRIEKQQDAAETGTVESGLASWADNTRLGGLMFLDATNLSQNLDGKKGSADGFGFDVKRFFLNVDHRFDETWSIHLTTDFHYSSSDGQSDIFVKRAYLQGAFAPLFVLRAGAANMPWRAYVEKRYGFRYVEKTVEERFGLVTISDWGVHVLGDRGIFDYQISVVSGGTFSHVNFRTRQPDGAFRLGLHPLPGMTLATGIYYGKHGKAVGGGPATRNGLLYHVLVAYAHNGLRLGGEYFNQMNPATYADGSFGGMSFPFPVNAALLRTARNRSDRADGYSLWASCRIMDPVTLFARFDHVRPSHDVDSPLRDTYFNAGVQYAVRKGILVALAYKHDKLRDNAHVLLDNEIGIFSAVKF